MKVYAGRMLTRRIAESSLPGKRLETKISNLLVHLRRRTGRNHTTQMIRRWEMGSAPCFNTILLLCDILECSCEEFTVEDTESVDGL